MQPDASPTDVDLAFGLVFERRVAVALFAFFLAIAVPNYLAGPVIPAGTLVASLILAAALALLAAVDLATLRLPNVLTLPLAGGGLLFAALLHWEPSWLWRAGAAIAGYGLIRSVAMLYARIRGRPGIGLGDAKLVLAGGAWLGPEGLPAAVLYGCVAALVLAGWKALRKQPIGASERIPFGPFLAGGIWIVWVYGPLV